MWRSFFKDKKWFYWSYGGGFFIITLLVLQTYLDVLFNSWYRDFYDILQTAEKREISEFWDSIKKFLYIALPYVTLFAFTNWFTRLWAFRWREAMTFSYMPYWRAAEAKIEGSSQRIQEDCMNFAKIVESIGLQVVKAIMTLIAFIPILWVLSSNVSVPFLNNVSGSLVWVALVLSIGGILISWLVGIKLPGLEYNNQKVEAAFRKELVYGEDDRKNYVQAPTILQLFTGIKFNYHKLFLHYGYFDLWAIWYRQLFVIVPFLIMAPGLFTAAFTLGVMMQVVNAFGEVKDAFSVFLYNWTRITELRSIHKRLMEFETAINYNTNKLRKPRKSDVRV
ncbi:MAG: putative transporter [Pseudomonadota bacterium]|nr:putative transporter [Pseudomonadota bacterium]